MQQQTALVGGLPPFPRSRQSHYPRSGLLHEDNDLLRDHAPLEDIFPQRDSTVHGNTALEQAAVASSVPKWASYGQQQKLPTPSRPMRVRPLLKDIANKSAFAYTCIARHRQRQLCIRLMARGSTLQQTTSWQQPTAYASDDTSVRPRNMIHARISMHIVDLHSSFGRIPIANTIGKVMQTTTLYATAGGNSVERAAEG